MTFTALHQALGRQPGPIDVEMLDEAVGVGVEESDGLDWKRELIPEKDLAKSDFPKDVAAFANSGGGVIVYGVTEEQRKATGRVDVGEVSESYERTLRRVAVSGIQPPVFGLDVARVGGEGAQALVVVVPASVDVPHLVYRGDYFGAPIRNHADTEWMRERQLEALYRQRLDDRRSADHAITTLYDELMAGRDTDQRAWMAVVAYPRVPLIGRRLTDSQMKNVMEATVDRALTWAPRTRGAHPVEAVNRDWPRRGLRRWAFVNGATGTRNWREAWMAVHDNGAVSVVTAIGGHRVGSGDTLPGSRVRSAHLEVVIVDLMAMLREATTALQVSGEYDVMVGIESDSGEPLLIETEDQQGFRFDDNSLSLGRYVPIRTSVRLDVDDIAYFRALHEICLDAVNQGGVQNVISIPLPASG